MNDQSSPHQSTFIPEPCFIGKSDAIIEIPIPSSVANGDISKSFLVFMSSPDSVNVTLGAEKESNLQRYDDGLTNNPGEIWRYTQDSVKWFGLTIVPSITCRIERSGLEDNTISVSVLSAETKLSGLGIVGRSVSAMVNAATTDGEIVMSWEEDTAKGVYHLNAKFQLNIHLHSSYAPSGVQSIGSKFVGRTCSSKLKQNLQKIRDEYISWSNK
jgi:hypothetical protein